VENDTANFPLQIGDSRRQRSAKPEQKSKGTICLLAIKPFVQCLSYTIAAAVIK